MREIKFRARDVTNTDGADMHYFKLGEGFSGMNSCPLMQYTGIKDKNGKEIYEGDIVKRFRKPTERKDWDWPLYEVYYSEDAFWLKPNNNQGSWLAVRRRPLEAIGNIYENPELLK